MKEIIVSTWRVCTAYKLNFYLLQEKGIQNKLVTEASFLNDQYDSGEHCL